MVFHVTWTTSLNWRSFENLVCIFWEIVKFHSLKTSNKCYVLDLKDSFVQLNFITSFWWCKSKIKRWNRTRLSWSRSVTTLQAYWLDIWDNNFCCLRASFNFEQCWLNFSKKKSAVNCVNVSEGSTFPKLFLWKWD